MRYSDFFQKTTKFKEELEIKNCIISSKNFSSNKEVPQDSDAMILFETSKQRTWLVTTRERLYCILDDIRKTNLNINWSMSKNEIISKNRKSTKLKIKSRPKPKAVRTGYVDIGNEHKNWLYSKELFKDQDVETEVKNFILRKMSYPQQNRD
ncbi:MAG: hypothetical protein COA66_04205 [Arcobacter sp.]|nr:MAG: hypothetical protein COA66_04205 [Arcobacter sp.]